MKKALLLIALTLSPFVLADEVEVTHPAAAPGVGAPGNGPQFPQPYPGNATLYVSIAFSGRTGIARSSYYAYPYTSQAESDAVSQCNKAVQQYTGTYGDCVAAVSSYGCASIAVGDGNKYGWAAMTNSSAQYALSECNTRTAYCTVRVTSCAPGYPRW